MADDDNAIPVLSETYPTTPGEDIGSDLSSIQEASRELTETRERDTVSNERPIDIVDYRDEKGDPHPDRSPISLRKAAADRADHRNRVVADRSENEAVNVAGRLVNASLPADPGFASQQTGEPQYAPQQQQDGLMSPGGGAYAHPTREEILNSVPQIQQYYQHNVALVQSLEAYIGQEAAAGHDLTDLYARRTNALQHVRQAEYLWRVAQAVNGDPANGVAPVDPRIAIPMATAEVVQGLQNIINGYQRYYEQQVTIALGMAERAHTNAQASMYAFFPELRGTAGPNYNNLHQVLAGIRSQNPARAKWIDYYLALQEQTYSQMRDLQDLQAQRHHQQRQQYVALHDAQLSERRPELKSEGVLHQTGLDVIEYMKSLGASMDEIRAAHSTPEFHNVVISQALYDASRMYKANKHIPKRRANPVASVMRPGSTTETPGRSAPKMPEAMNGAAGLRQAADMLTARRQGRR